MTIIPLNRQHETTKPVGKINGIDYRLVNFPLLDRLSLQFLDWVRGALAIAVVTYRLFVARERPKFLFCMTMWWWAALSISILGKLFRIKTLYYLVEEPAALARMQYENGDTGWFSLRLKLIQAKLVYFAVSFFDLVCCIVKPLRDRAVENGVRSERVWVLPNMRYLVVRKDRIRRKAKCDEPANSAAKILYTGRINYTRDEFHTLLSAAELAKGSRSSYVIEIYGSGPAKDLALIEKIIREKGLEQIVHLKGYVSKDELIRAQSEASTFLLLKADIEQNKYNFPTKLMDYLDNGRPVIMTRIQNHLEHFEDNVSCFFVNAQDAPGLHSAIIRCVDDHETALKVGLAGRVVLEEKFNASIEAKKLLEFAGLSAN